MFILQVSTLHAQNNPLRSFRSALYSTEDKKFK